MENQDDLQEFSLEDILNEFRDPEEESAPAPEAPPAQTIPEAPEASSAPEAPAAPEEAALPEMPEEAEALPEEPSDTPLPEEPAVDGEDTPPAEDTDPTTRLDTLSGFEEDLSPCPDENADTLADIEAEFQPEAEEAAAEPQEEAPHRPPIPFPGNEQLRDLKRKLIAGPEKRFYELSEIGVTNLQVGIFLNILVFILCAATTIMYAAEIIPENRLRFVIFSQVLAMLISALLGSQQMLDGLADLTKFRFSINTLLTVTFLSCCADSLFCLRDLRIPCCSAFTLEMTFALFARYHRRSTEMAQMDTLRKAVKLGSVVKEPDVYNGRPGILRGTGAPEDFLDTYQQSPGPQKLQSVYCFIAMILCLGIAALAGLRHDPSMAVQILSTSLLVAVPASSFITITRPIALLERRLHLVGAVICGWQGVKKLCGKAVFPIRDSDLFPAGSIKLNGVKYYGNRAPEQILSYTSSLITAAGSSLESVFRNLLNNRGATEYPVSEFTDYGSGGIGGMVQGEAVLMGSLNFMQDMGVDIPQGTMVSQAVYAAINGELCAVVAISYAKMRSASAGLVSLCGYRKLIPVLAAQEFMLTEEFIHEKFAVKTRRMQFPDRQTRAALSAKQPDPESQVLALVTRDDLASAVYTVSGSAALNTACRLGLIIHLLGGILGILTMLALAYQGSVELLTPINVLLYQLIWMVPGFLVTEWTRTV